MRRVSAIAAHVVDIEEKGWGEGLAETSGSHETAEDYNYTFITDDVLS